MCRGRGNFTTKGRDMKIKIDDLDTSLQVRYGVDAKAVCDYAEAMKEGAKFPDVTVFTDGETYWLADGFHRMLATQQTGKATVAANVTHGTRADALRYALKANGSHGVRMTNADKRHALEVAWENMQELFGGEPSTRLLADTCGVSEFLAKQFRAEVRVVENTTLSSDEANTSEQNRVVENTTLPTRPTAPVRPTRVGRDGKAYAVPARPTAPARPQRAPARPVRQIPRDRYGTEIPVGMQEAFESSPLADILSCISKARVALRKGFEEKDPAFAAVRQDALVNLNNAYNFVNAAEPHCVCRMCQGNGCKACHERGWQTEEEYKRNPKEFQAKGGAK